jgi:hypothetical protein
LTAVVKETRSRRIVVVFGGGGSDTSVAGVLASLVSESGTDIMGVFLEDHSLFRLAELPFTTELCRVTTTRHPLTTGELERQMKVQALRAEQAVRSVAERAGSPWSFRTHRGRLSTALAEARDVDLLLLGTARRVLASAGELHATARTVRAGEVESLRPVAVLFDQADTTGRALDAGIELAQRTGRGLIVFLSDEATEAQTQVARQLHSWGPRRAVVRPLPSTELGALLAAVRRAAPAVLIVGAGETGFEEARIGALQSELRCPMVVVRSMPA